MPNVTIVNKMTSPVERAFPSDPTVEGAVVGGGGGAVGGASGVTAGGDGGGGGGGGGVWGGGGGGGVPGGVSLIARPYPTVSTSPILVGRRLGVEQTGGSGDAPVLCSAPTENAFGEDVGDVSEPRKTFGERYADVEHPARAAAPPLNAPAISRDAAASIERLGRAVEAVAEATWIAGRPERGDRVQRAARTLPPVPVPVLADKVAPSSSSLRLTRSDDEVIRRELVVAHVAEDTDVHESDGGDGLQATGVSLHKGQVVFEENDRGTWIEHDVVDYHPVRYGARTEADRYADSGALDHQEQTSFLADLGDDNLWRLFIDYDRQSAGPTAFDRDAEPGYMKAMLAAFRDAVGHEKIDSLPDAISYAALHAAATSDVEGIKIEDDGGERRSTAGGGTHYGMQAPPSPQALTEMAAEGLLVEVLPSEFLEFFGGEGAPTDADSLYFCLQKYRDYDEAPFLFGIVVKMYGAVEHIVAVAHRDAAKNQEHMERRFGIYESEVLAAGDERTRIVAIARLVRALGVGHFFLDANRRASVFLLMNKLLLQIGSSPSIMRDVSLFDARVPLSEIVAAVIDGQRVVTEGDWPDVEEEAE